MSLASLPEQAASPAGREILTRMMQLHPKSIDLSLGRLRRLLAKLDHPERRLPPVVHVAGTNGKGSTIAFMRAGLEAAGYRVHVHISPHLVRFNERFRLAGRLIEDGALERVLGECERVNDGDQITFFEIVTAAAFLAFAETPADILLLETGLGGRFDATNVVENPVLTAITPVSYDHQKFLGHSLSGIAAEKAGILKPGVPALLGPQMTEGLDTIEACAAKVGAPLLRAGRDWRIEGDASGLRYHGREGTMDLPVPSLPGAHQHDNAGLAIACLRRLPGFEVGQAALAQAMGNTVWPARMQRLRDGAMAALLPPGSELWLDGGHNPAAGEVVAATLAQWRLGDLAARPLHLVFGMLRGKDSSGFLKPFRALAPQIKAVTVPGEPASLSAAEALAAAESEGFSARECASVEQALQRIAQEDGRAGAPPRVLICGTLYLAGHVLARNGTLPA